MSVVSRSLLAAGLVAVLGLVAPHAALADAVTSVTPESFADGAAIDNRFEMESAKLAMQKSSNKKILALSQRMLASHQKADAALAGMMAKASPPIAEPADGLDSAHQGLIDSLNQAQPQDFDKTWSIVEAKAYDEAVRLYGIYSVSGEKGALKDFATDTLPDLRKDQRQLTSLQIGRGVGGN